MSSGAVLFISWLASHKLVSSYSQPPRCHLTKTPSHLSHPSKDNNFVQVGELPPSLLLLLLPWKPSWQQLLLQAAPETLTFIFPRILSVHFAPFFFFLWLRLLPFQLSTISLSPISIFIIFPFVSSILALFQVLCSIVSTFLLLLFPSHHLSSFPSPTSVQPTP